MQLPSLPQASGAFALPGSSANLKASSYLPLPSGIIPMTSSAQ